MDQCPEGRPSSFTTIGSTFCRWSIYLAHTSRVSLLQYVLIPSLSCGRLLGLYLSSREVFMDPQTFSIGFRSGLSAWLIHQVTLFCSKKFWMHLLVCLGLLSWNNLWPSLVLVFDEADSRHQDHCESLGCYTRKLETEAGGLSGTWWSHKLDHTTVTYLDCYVTQPDDACTSRLQHYGTWALIPDHCSHFFVQCRRAYIMTSSTASPGHYHALTALLDLHQGLVSVLILSH